MGVLERGKNPHQQKKSQRKKAREDAPLQATRLPENLPIAERPEPQQVNPEGNRAPAAENDNGNNGDKEKQSAAVAALRRRSQLGPINCFWHFDSTLSIAALPEVQGLQDSPAQL
jgi:hypothetical protein